MFVDAADTMSERDARAASGLPGWSRAHVVAHLVLNAEGFCTSADALASTSLGVMYPRGAGARDAAIEELSAAPIRELTHRLNDAHRRFMTAWTDPSHHGPCASTPGSPTFASTTVLGRRLRELQVHLVDLGLPAVDHTCWIDEFVDHDLSLQWMTVEHRTREPIAALDDTGRRWTAHLAADASHEPVGVDRRSLLAWTLDRHHVDGLPHLDAWGNRSRWEHTAGA